MTGTADIAVLLEETADINDIVKNNKPPRVPSIDQASELSKTKVLKKTFGNGRRRCEVKKSHCITHNKKLVKVKQKRVIGSNGVLEVKSFEVPILVCPSSARPGNPALGESLNTQVIRKQTKKSEALVCNQTIEGRVD